MHLRTLKFPTALQLVLIAAICSTPSARAAEKWSIPPAGNAFPAAEAGKRIQLDRNGGLRCSSVDEQYSMYFRVDRPVAFKLSVMASVQQGHADLQVAVGDQSTAIRVGNVKPKLHPVGGFEADQAGYVQVDLQASALSGGATCVVDKLVITAADPEVDVSYVKDNSGNMFYWGRRGPSVHLTYQVPQGKDIQFAYSELTVPVGFDPVGSYFMANGFAEGYFGMQVNGPVERRILFSVWSPYKTDNPSEIPVEQRVRLLGKGSGVHVGKFGNEGSGGQSYLVYPWEAGRTYRFLTEVVPAGSGRTRYTCWFGDKADQQLRLIASFLRPKTDTHLKRFHSFLENFDPRFGNRQRKVRYSNVWVRDVSGTWHACTAARFSVDATGGGGHRLDFSGGSRGDHFFLKNCGFFDDTGQPGALFQREPSDGPPEIDLESLPRK